MKSMLTVPASSAATVPAAGQPMEAAVPATPISDDGHGDGTLKAAMARVESLEGQVQALRSLALAAYHDLGREDVAEIEGLCGQTRGDERGPLVRRKLEVARELDGAL